MVSSYAWSYVKLEILKRTVLATLWSALWPVYLLKVATSVDNPFSVARNRSEKAGQVLADALINKAQGERPVTLIGYSLGARVIYSCLRSLAERKAFGLIEDVVLIGAPIPSTTRNWQIMKSVVSGQITNVYSENDYILAFLYRATSIQLGVAGLQNIEGIEGVSNLDLSEHVSGTLIEKPDIPFRLLSSSCSRDIIFILIRQKLILRSSLGHLRYPDLIGQILRRCGVHGVTVHEEEIENDLPDEGGKQDTHGQRSRSGGLESEDLIDFGEEDISTSTVPAPQEQIINTPIPSPAAVQSRSLAQHQSQNVSFLDRDETVSSQMANLRVRDQQRDSDSEDDGIVMVDNDGDGELQMLSGEPEPDEDHTSVQDHTTLHRNQFSEPKSLGSFAPR